MAKKIWLLSDGRSFCGKCRSAMGTRQRLGKQDRQTVETDQLR